MGKFRLTNLNWGWGKLHLHSFLFIDARLAPNAAGDYVKTASIPWWWLSLCVELFNFIFRLNFAENNKMFSLHVGHRWLAAIHIHLRGNSVAENKASLGHLLVEDYYRASHLIELTLFGYGFCASITEGRGWKPSFEISHRGRVVVRHTMFGPLYRGKRFA